MPLERETNAMPRTLDSASQKGSALRQTDEVWHLHDLDEPSESSAGCLAFVVERRCIQEDGIEFHWP